MKKLLPIWHDMRIIYHSYNVSLALMLVLLAFRYHRKYGKRICKEKKSVLY